MSKTIRKRYISQDKLTREQAFWLCRAVLQHYRADGSTEEHRLNQQDINSRSHKSDKFKRGRDWVIHPVGYDLNEEWYGTPQSGFREAWASLVSLPISRVANTPEQYRTYNTYGLVHQNKLTIAVYHITEVVATSMDQGFLKYVLDCFARLKDDATDAPEYDPRHG